jgi:hypothetical protein
MSNNTADFGETIKMLIENNSVAIHANMVRDGLLSAGAGMNKAALAAVIQQQNMRLKDSDFAAWIERTFDNPINQKGMYGNILAALQYEWGRSPALVLADSVRDNSENTIEQISTDFKGKTTSEKVVTILIVASVIFSVLAAGRWLYRQFT